MFKILATTLAFSLAACAASAATLSIVGGTVGTVPGGKAKNDALAPLGFPNSLAGFYGSAIELVGSNGKLKFERLGAEAGYTNKFIYTATDPDLTLTDPGGGNFFNPNGIDSFTVSNVLEGLLGFKFHTSGGNLSVANGSNPDNTQPTPKPGINFFATFGDGNTRNGSILYLFFDDDGANNDDNHDDLVIRISVVPLPAGGLLLIGAVAGLAALRRRKARAA